MESVGELETSVEAALGRGVGNMRLDPTMSLDITTLQTAYRAGHLSVRQMSEIVRARIDAAKDKAVWIRLCDPDLVERAALALDERGALSLPLFGIPFAVKDNIDVAGLPTTAACPEFAAMSENTAPIVQRLLNAGALLIGKTNLDQFATGLVGVRSPYGAPRSPFDARYISGGSSSGSAVAVATGLVSFALGTDTAGSGRVPAAFTNLVGLKPSRGLVSTSGVLPACRSLDCPSIFALSSEDASRVLSVIGGFDPIDPYSRATLPPLSPLPPPCPERFCFAIPRKDQLVFFDDGDWSQLFDQTVKRLVALGGEGDVEELLRGHEAISP